MIHPDMETYKFPSEHNEMNTLNELHKYACTRKIGESRTVVFITVLKWGIDTMNLDYNRHHSWSVKKANFTITLGPQAVFRIYIDT